jgi:hypothetical protein
LFCLYAMRTLKTYVFTPCERLRLMLVAATCATFAQGKYMREGQEPP